MTIVNVVDVGDIFKEINRKGLPSLEQIASGYKCKPVLRGADATNPLRFALHAFSCSEYLVATTECFRGQIVVDIGSGRCPDGYALAKICGAEAYIAVDHAHIQQLFAVLKDSLKAKGDADLLERIRNGGRHMESVQGYPHALVMRLRTAIEDHLGSGAEIPIALAPEDMLTFLKRIPARAVSVLASGIDRCIIGDDAYAERIEAEISRVMTNNGAYVGIFSRFKPQALKPCTSINDRHFQKFTR